MIIVDDIYKATTPEEKEKMKSWFVAIDWGVPNGDYTVIYYPSTGKFEYPCKPDEQS